MSVSDGGQGDSLWHWSAGLRRSSDGRVSHLHRDADRNSADVSQETAH